MKQKLEKPQDAFKILEKSYGYKIPKDWYRVEFPKINKNRKKRKDTIWKDYTTFLFAQKRIFTCIRMITEKLQKKMEEQSNLIDEGLKDTKKRNHKKMEEQSNLIDERLKDTKKRNHKKMSEVSYLVGHLTEALFNGFAILKEENTGKCYLTMGRAEKFFQLLIKKYDTDLSKITPKLRSFKYDNNKIAGDKIIIKFPDKMETAKSIVKEEMYWKQRHKYWEKTINDMKNDDRVREEVSELYKRSMKMAKEPKYDLKFFMNYDPKYKKYWVAHWRFFLKIR